jgi:hypothetical protein
MKFLLLPLFLLSGLVAYLAHADSAPAVQVKALLAGEPTAADVARSKASLTAWENDAPAKAKRLMRIVYWSPADREPQPEFRPRLTRVMQHIQGFYGREMASWGFPGRSIQLDIEADGLMKIYSAKGTLKNAECSEADGSDGQAIRRDALSVLKDAGIDGNKETVVIFCNLAEWDPIKRKMSHHSPYYASGDSKGGTAWQVDSPLLDSDVLGVKDQMLDDGQYGHISLGKYNSIFVGGVCHELGHALGLPHCKEDPAHRAVRGTALMGSGNRTYGEELRGESKGSFLTLAHALKLAAHPQFSGSVKEIETSVKSTYTDWQLKPTPAGLQVNAKVQANLPVHGIIAYADPAGGADYDSEIAAAVPAADGSFQLVLPRSQKKNCPATLHFVTLCVNGAASSGVWSAQAFTLPCTITGDSSYDVGKAQESLALAANFAAMRANTLTKEQASSIPPRVQETFRRLALPDSSKGKLPPADAPAATVTLNLSDAAPVSAETGWGGAHYDRTSDGNPLVGADGLLTHGLYAHADSEYVYRLNGKWDTLTGQCTLLDKGYGTVEGIILADDKPLWKSDPIKAGTNKSFSVSVKDVQVLKLQIKAKSKNGAWGAWGEPALTRAAP